MAALQVGDPGTSIRFKLDTRGLEDDFAKAPATAYYWLRGYLGGCFVDHRRYWLANKGTRFGRAGQGSKATKVFPLNQAPEGALRDNWVVYQTNPKQSRVTPEQAPDALKQLSGSAAAGSLVLQLHQEGGELHSSKWMAIPIRTRPGTPAAWRAANPGKVLIVLADPGRPNRLFLAERIRRKHHDHLRKRFLLVKSVKLKPTLRFYESWDALEQERAKNLAFCADRIQQDIARGKST